MQESVKETVRARYAGSCACLHLSRPGRSSASRQKVAVRGTSRAWLFAVMIAVVALFTGVALSFAQNQITIANQPASEGRPISPAGSLIPDAATGNPAVG